MESLPSLQTFCLSNHDFKIFVFQGDTGENGPRGEKGNRVSKSFSVSIFKQFMSDSADLSTLIIPIFKTAEFFRIINRGSKVVGNLVANILQLFLFYSF